MPKPAAPAPKEPPVPAPRLLPLVYAASPSAVGAPAPMPEPQHLTLRGPPQALSDYFLKECFFSTH